MCARVRRDPPSPPHPVNGDEAALTQQDRAPTRRGMPHDKRGEVDQGGLERPSGPPAVG